MKYIRTNQWIFEEEKRRRDEECGVVYEYSIVRLATLFRPIAYIPVSNIIKEADTIEELCDGFVVYREGEGKLIFDGTHRFYKVYAKKSVFESAMEEYNDFKDSGEEIWVKGFIWTDKGLIYVAKLNEKGELELL